MKLNSREKRFLMQAFAALGPERVRHGLGATGHAWADCFLSCALRNELGNAVGNQAWARARWLVARDMGFAAWAADEIATLWDWKEGAFRAAATEWLAAAQPRPGAVDEHLLTPS